MDAWADRCPAPLVTYKWDGQQSGTDSGQCPDWQKGLMHMDVQPVEAYIKSTPKTEASSDLSISWSHAAQAAIPAAPDMIVVPAERNGVSLSNRDHATA